MTGLKRIATAFAFAAVLLLSTAGAEAQQLCTVRDEALSQLEGKFDEQVVGRGLVESGRAIVELFVSENATWTVVVTDTTGRSCIVASGMDWMRTPLLVGDPA
ncbi:MAG: hypothetical protein V3R74_08015 [Alphaproteobacteria bacterium]|jgi:hypothetical protein